MRRQHSKWIANWKRVWVCMSLRSLDLLLIRRCCCCCFFLLYAHSSCSIDFSVNLFPTKNSKSSSAFCFFRSFLVYVSEFVHSFGQYMYCDASQIELIRHQNQVQRIFLFLSFRFGRKSKWLCILFAMRVLCIRLWNSQELVLISPFHCEWSEWWWSHISLFLSFSLSLSLFIALLMFDIVLVCLCALTLVVLLRLFTI